MLNNKDLGLSYPEYESLVRVRDMLRSGMIKEALDFRSRSDGYLPAGLNFNMDYTARRGDCGSVCCIGGWVYALTYGEEYKDKDGNVLYKYDDHVADEFVFGASGGLYALFYPNEDHTRPDGTYWSYRRITAQQAAQAIDNYLTTGQPRWGDILGPNNIDEE